MKRFDKTEIMIPHEIINPNLSGFKIIYGKEVKKSDIESALFIDYLSYEDIYHLDLDKCVEYHRKNPYIYIMMANSQRDIVGYINFSPVTEKLYEILKSGKEVDTVIEAEDILEYKKGNEYCVYLSSICVHPMYRSKGIARELIRKLDDLLRCLYALDIRVKKIVADAVSISGENILLNLGFNIIRTSEHGTKIMEKIYG